MKFGIFQRFCMTQAVRLRNFCFWLVCERHFAEEFDDLEWQEMPGIQFAVAEGLCAFSLVSLRTVLSFVDGRTWTLRTAVVLLSACWILVFCLP